MLFMGNAKANWVLRKALKHRTQKARRRRVLGFYASALVCLLMTLGADHGAYRGLVFAAAPVLIAMSLAVSRGLRNDPYILIRSLDDRAQVEYGTNFDQLSDSAQKELLSRYRMFASPLDGLSEGRRRPSRPQVESSAFRFLTRALAWFVALYWILYWFVPAGVAREMLTDTPVLIALLAVFVISLPSVIEAWTVPDEVREPIATASAVQA